METLDSSDPAHVTMPPPSLTPEIYRPQVNLAIDSVVNGRKEEGRRRFYEIINQDPKSAEADFCRAEIAAMDLKYSEAVSYFDAALSKNPQLETAYNDRGNAYISLKMPDKAIRDYSIAMLLGPGPVHWACRANAYNIKKNYALAERDATVAVEKDPNYDYAYSRRAIARENLGNIEGAIADLNKVVELNKNSAMELYRRGQFYMRQILPEQARADFLAAERKEPSDVDYYYWVGKASLLDQNFQQAVKDFTLYREKSVAQNKTDDVETADYCLKKAKTGIYDQAHMPKEKNLQWAIACSAQLAMQNDSGFCSLSGEEPTPARIADEKRLLIKWWGVHNREDLLQVLSGQLTNGHNVSWMNFRKLLANKSPIDKGQVLTLLESAADPDGVAVVKEHGDQLGERGLLAWDLCRYISLCRWGYQVGYLSEKEASERIIPVAKKLQKTYTSWEQLGKEYLIGRKFWSIKNYKEDENDSMKNLSFLLKSPKSPWVYLPWDTQL